MEDAKQEEKKEREERSGQEETVLARARRRVSEAATSLWCSIKRKVACGKGQGTTEYAILVGVLVVIAIVAITLFRPKIQELWDAIATGINGL